MKKLIVTVQIEINIDEIDEDYTAMDNELICEDFFGGFIDAFESFEIIKKEVRDEN